MKRIIKYITLINLLILIGGCNEDFIEQKPLGQQSAEVFNPDFKAYQWIQNYCAQNEIEDLDLNTVRT